jgi:hypothetical protein
MMVIDETCEVIPNEDTICNVIKDKQSLPEHYTWLVKTVLSQLNAMLYTKMVKTGKVKPSDIFSATDEAYALVNVEGNLKQWIIEAELMAVGTIDAKRSSLLKSDCTIGGSKADGWTEEGINRFNELVWPR